MTDSEWQALRAEWEQRERADLDDGGQQRIIGRQLIKFVEFFRDHSAALRAEIDALRKRVRELEEYQDDIRGDAMDRNLND